VVDVYGIVFAPYASEDVFLRESTMVAGVLAQRFDAQGRVLQLVNHMTTGDAALGHAAEPARAVDAAAASMDKDEDVLVVYLTSHGGSDFRWPPRTGRSTSRRCRPRQLREALDAAGIRHRVVAVSACYSGGWVEPLASDTTLVMTAADATHTSYGCGHRSPLTFFGRAMFDEQLRRPTRSRGLRRRRAGDPAARGGRPQAGRLLQPADQRGRRRSGRCCRRWRSGWTAGGRAGEALNRLTASLSCGKVAA
jgi:hypothetical protein